ncbi:hypothetical protein FACS1894204_06300 [Synergistales bacterium]|nr:hypothetical protein FACS1894204_06300 [Synergistales bacterium]
MKLLVETVILGLPPTVNTMYRRAGKTVYKKPEVKAWQRDISTMLSLEKYNKTPYAGSVSLAIFCISPRYKSIDADNRIKALQDCLAMAGIIEDDKQVTRVECQKFPADIDKKEKTQIMVWTMPEETEA